jgi:hypothetical protein
MGQELLVFIEKEASVSNSSREATWRQLHHAVHEEEKAKEVYWGGLWLFRWRFYWAQRGIDQKMSTQPFKS